MPLNPEQINQFRTQYGIKPASEARKETGYFGRVVRSIFESGKDIKESVGRGAEIIAEAGVETKPLSERLTAPLRGAARAGVGTAGAVIRGATAPLTEALAPLIEPIIKPIAETETAQKVISEVNAWAEKNPDMASNLKDLVDIITTITGTKIATAPITKATARTALRAGKEAIETGLETAGKAFQGTKTTLFGKEATFNTLDDVVKATETAIEKAPAEIRSAAEQATAKPNIFERWAGISDDIKNRIKGKQDKLKEYFDVSHARNNFDTLPTPLEHGAKQVDSAVERMEGILNDTGSDIGAFRKKIGTYEANIDNVKKVESSFNNELSKLNLEIKNGVVRQKPGTLKRVGSDNDIKVLNDLYDNLRTVKENPSLEKLIDLRNLFDAKINFEKQARDISSALDIPSRNIRKQIADVAAEIVGKTEAGRLKEFSEFMDAYNALRSFTDRKAGAEFLLKQVLSERGGVSREVMQAIKKHTGIDLMDDAVMAQIATDLIGNSRQKGLFRQELIKAGLDAEKILSGKGGAVQLLWDVASKRLIDAEKQFLKAAK